MSAIDDSDSREAPPREGLPASYRMRADSHYIDQLDAPPVTPVQTIPVRAIDGVDDTSERPIHALVDSINRYGILEPLLVQKRDRRYRLINGRKRLVAARACGLLDVPCLVHRVSDEEAKRIVAATTVTRTHSATVDVDALRLSAAEDDVQRSLGAILRCTPLLSDAVPALTRSVAVDMLTAEAHRAACALSAMRVIRDGVPDATRPVSTRDVVQKIVDRVSADLRLRGIAIDTPAPVEAPVIGDAELLASTMASVVFVLSAALDRGNGARLFVTASRDAGGPITIAIEQEAVILPDAWIALTGDRVDGPMPQEMVPLLALRRVAEAYGGRLTASRLRRASRVAIELPPNDE